MWVVKLEQVVNGARVAERIVAELEAPDRLDNLDDLGLALDDGKAIIAALQQALVADQVVTDTEARRWCAECGRRRRIKDYRPRTIDTVFGRSQLRAPGWSAPTAKQ